MVTDNIRLFKIQMTYWTYFEHMKGILRFRYPTCHCKGHMISQQIYFRLKTQIQFYRAPRNVCKVEIHKKFKNLLWWGPDFAIISTMAIILLYFVVNIITRMYPASYYNIFIVDVGNTRHQEVKRNERYLKKKS